MRRNEYGCHDGTGLSQTSSETRRKQLKSLGHADKYQEHST